MYLQTWNIICKREIELEVVTNSHVILFHTIGKKNIVLHFLNPY